MPEPVLVIACGALAREIRALLAPSRFRHVHLACLPASLHNRPERIPDAVRQRIRAAREHYRRIFVAYGDCGTGGELDRLLAEEGVERIEGPHCYAFYDGLATFEARAEAEPASFYLTDFLVRQFDSLVWRGLGLDRHPELRPLYFGNYRKLVHLAQTDDAVLRAEGRRAAERLGLAYEYRFTGYGGLADFLARAARSGDDGAADPRVLAGHPGPGDRPPGTPDGET